MKIRLKAVGFNERLAGIPFVDSVSQVEVGYTEAARLRGMGMDWEEVPSECDRCKALQTEFDELYEKFENIMRESGVEDAEPQTGSAVTKKTRVKKSNG